jgi:hypothetical protein
LTIKERIRVVAAVAGICGLFGLLALLTSPWFWIAVLAGVIVLSGLV